MEDLDVRYSAEDCSWRQLGNVDLEDVAWKGVYIEVTFHIVQLTIT